MQSQATSAPRASCRPSVSTQVRAIGKQQNKNRDPKFPSLTFSVSARCQRQFSIGGLPGPPSECQQALRSGGETGARRTGADKEISCRFSKARRRMHGKALARTRATDGVSRSQPVGSYPGSSPSAAGWVLQVQRASLPVVLSSPVPITADPRGLQDAAHGRFIWEEMLGAGRYGIHFFYSPCYTFIDLKKWKQSLLILTLFCGPV